MERFRGIFLIAGLAFFGFSFVAMGLIPYLHLRPNANDPDRAFKTAEDLAPTVLPWFEDLARRYPQAFDRAFEAGPSIANCADALREGRDIFIAEGCWHCHSQFIRPVSNEDLRWGKISYPAEYQNELQMPQLFGTRRVGPDLVRESGLHSNDWHVVHFRRPRDVSPTSVMPSFPWFVDRLAGALVPNRRGFAIITYVQWLGSWIETDEENGRVVRP